MPALAVYAISLATYALTAGAAIGWLDAPELVAAGSSLGIPHSPGHPVVVMISKLATLLPIGDIAFRVGLASAAAAAAAATAIFCLIRAALTPILLGGSKRSTLAIDGIAVGAALTAAFSWALWFQGVRAEVYALETLLCVAALTTALAFCRSRAPRHLLLFAFLAGLAATNHPAIGAATLLPAAALIIASRPPLRLLARAAAMATVSLGALLYLPVRAAADPALNWGDPSTIGRFLWTVSGRAFHKTAGAEHASSFGQDLAQAFAAVATAATIPLSLLALLGVYLAVRNRTQLGQTLMFVAVLALSLVGRALLGFDPETPDHHAYLIPAIVSVIALGTLAIGGLARAVERAGSPSALAAPSAALAMIALAAVQLLANHGRSTLGSERASDQLIETTTAELPPRALLLSAYFETRFQLYAAAEMFGSRPDVTVLDRSFLTYPGAEGHETRHHPDLAALIAAPLRAGVSAPLALIDAQTETRPVLVELHPNVGRDLRARLAPLGAFALYLRQPSTAMRDQVEALDAEAMERLAKTATTDVPFDGERAMLSFIWRDFHRLQLYCELGRRDAALVTYARLEAIVPADRQLQALATACGVANTVTESQP